MTVRNHPLFTVWRKMRERCYNPREISYKRYGARGISVCDEWRNSSRLFVEWALANGWVPGLQIDRINNDGPYSPENCRWITRSQNLRNCRSNRIVTFNGDSLALIEWSERTGIPYSALVARLNKGWSVEQALTQPARPQLRRTTEINGERISVSEAAKRTGLSQYAIYNRMRRGWEPSRAMTETRTTLNEGEVCHREG